MSFLKISLQKDTLIRVMTISDQQIPYSNFAFLDGKSAKETFDFLQSESKRIIPDQPWKQSAAWSCSILANWAEIYPDFSWKIEESSNYTDDWLYKLVSPKKRV